MTFCVDNRIKYNKRFFNSNTKNRNIISFIRLYYKYRITLNNFTAYFDIYRA